MSSQKLNSSEFRERLKKYDTYQHRTSRTVGNSTHNRIVRPTQKNIKRSLSPKQIVQNISSSSQVSVTHNSRGVALAAVAKSKEIVDGRGFLVRQFTDESLNFYTPVKAKTTSVQKVMYGFGVFVFALAITASIHTVITNNSAKNQIAALGENISKDEQGVSEGTGGEPSEEPVSESALFAYQVRNLQDPRYIRIPEISVFARVKNLGLDGSAVDAPHNIHDAGWFNESGRPGVIGRSTLVVGHVSSWTSAGVFKNLNKLKVGSTFEIEKGNAEIVNYKVVKTKKISADQVDMFEILKAENPKTHDIKLMTCAGKYDKKTKTFEDRFIVYAEQVK